MRRLLSTATIVLLCVVGSTVIRIDPARAFFSGYSYKRAVTIDYTKVPNTDQADFPMLFKGTYAYLAHTTHSGKATDLNGYDIIFTSDSAGNTQLDHEIESYNHETGAVVFWVRVPAVSHETDTVIYLWYGNSAVSTSQEDKNGVWDAHYKAVWHCSGGDGATMADSTANGKDLTVTNGHTTTGPFADPAYLADNNNLQRAVNADTTYWNSIAAAGKVTIECWVKLGDTGYRDGMSNWNGTGAFGFLVNNLKPSSLTLAGGTIRYREFTALTQDEWTHLVFALDATTSPNTTIANFKNGQSDDQSYGGGGNGISNSSVGFDLGGNYISAPLLGSLDEVRVSDSLRGADWVAASYNSQSAPSSFYGIGDESAASTPSRFRSLLGGVR